MAERLKRSIGPVIIAVLLLEVGYIVWRALTKQEFDFYVYLWGGRAVGHDSRLYLKQAAEHWFTYPPFAAVVFAPLTHLPFRLARLLWTLASVGCVAIVAAHTLRLAGLRRSWTMLAGIVAAALLLEPLRHTLELGQINLILLALILYDVVRVSAGRWGGVGVGVAAAIKLTPGLFGVLFLLARRTRSALIAAASFLVCTAIGVVVAPNASRMYWEHLFYDTKRVGSPFISNQSPYGAAVRLLGGVGHVGGWYPVVTVVFGVVGLIAATLFARRDLWLDAATTAGVTTLLVSPISWSHHWVWVVPVLVLLALRGRRGQIAAAGGYVLFVLGPMWWTPHFGGPSEYGFHGLTSLVANCYLLAGVAFLAYQVPRSRADHDVRRRSPGSERRDRADYVMIGDPPRR